jgi:hypothetical protein
VSLLFAGAPVGSKWGCWIPHSAGPLTFVSGLSTRVGRVRVTTIQAQSSYAYTFLPELGGMQRSGSAGPPFDPLHSLGKGRQSPASWVMLQKATSFG